jgi:hypothetical protein
MLPNHIITGKPKSGRNFSNQFCQLFGVTANQCFVLTFDHDPHQRLCARLAQQHATTPGHSLGDALADFFDSRMLDRVFAAAKTVRMPYWNTQDQQKYVWAPSFVLARAYLDQLARTNGLSADAIGRAHDPGDRGEGLRRPAPDRADRARVAARRGGAGAGDSAKVRTLAKTVTELAGTR